jgi:hypothetical protein
MSNYVDATLATAATVKPISGNAHLAHGESALAPSAADEEGAEAARLQCGGPWSDLAA